MNFDIAVIGSGFAGSIMAMIARRLGHSVALLERGKHPRFAIGESSTPLANLSLEELARRYDLPGLLPLTKWGSWQHAHPEIAVGLKRGFTFCHHQFRKPFASDPERHDQLLVAASPRDEIGDTHWYRADFDAFLVHEAQRLGVEYLDQARLDSVSTEAEGVAIEGIREGQAISLRARFVIDASGPRGFLHRALRLPEVAFENLPSTQALYTHFTGVKRLDQMEVFRPCALPPYPVDDAAVHHIFEGGWVWVLRFNNGVTSAGIAATDKLANELCFAEGAPAWKRLLQRLPTLHEQFSDATAEFPFVHAPKLSFRTGTVNGARWALLPSAAGFVDPLLSTGFPLTLLGIDRLGRILESAWNSTRLEARLHDYSTRTLDELEVTAQLVAALYATMNDFPLFSALSLLYFAAASFTETARRLGKPQLAGDTFLLGDHPGFGEQAQACFLAAVRLQQSGGLRAVEKVQLIEKIFRVIEPVDIAGLGKRERRNWHRVNTADLFESATKLQANCVEIKAMVKRCGF